MPARRLVIPLVAALPVGLGIAAPAQAGPPLDRGVYSGEYAFPECGGAYEVTGTFVSREIVRDSTPPLAGEFFKFSRTYEFTDTITNPLNDEFITVHVRGHFIELQPTTDDGRVFEYVAHDAGMATIRDSSGNLLFREAGLLAFPTTFDTLGDGEPGGEVLAEGEPRVAGPHPTFDVDFCALLDDLIG